MLRIAIKLYQIAKGLESLDPKAADRVEGLARSIVNEPKKEAYIHEVEAIQKLLTIRLHAFKQAVGDTDSLEEISDQVSSMMGKALVENDANAKLLLEALMDWKPGQTKSDLVMYMDLLGSWMLEQAYQEHLERQFGKKLQKIRTHEADFRLKPRGAEEGLCRNTLWGPEFPHSSKSCPDFIEKNSRDRNPFIAEIKNRYKQGGGPARVGLSSLPKDKAGWPGFHTIFGDYAGFGDPMRTPQGWTGYKELPRSGTVSIYDLSPSLFGEHGVPDPRYADKVSLDPKFFPDPIFEGEVEGYPLAYHLQKQKGQQRDLAQRSLNKLLMLK